MSCPKGKIQKPRVEVAFVNFTQEILRPVRSALGSPLRAGITTAHLRTRHTTPPSTSSSTPAPLPHLAMADRKAGAYGTNTGGDTAFRKTWDRDEYAAKAIERDKQIKEEGKARYEAALQGKKYHRRASTPPDARDTEARKARLNVADRVGTTSIVPAGAGQGKRGKGAGFYCDACDLTFKDNLQFVEHLNSRQHLVNTGESGEVKRAGLEEVRERFAWLVRKREEEREREVVDLGTRIEVAREVEEREREEKRRRRNEKRRKTQDGMGNQNEVKVEDDGNIF